MLIVQLQKISEARCVEANGFLQYLSMSVLFISEDCVLPQRSTHCLHTAKSLHVFKCELIKWVSKDHGCIHSVFNLSYVNRANLHSAFNFPSFSVVFEVFLRGFSFSALLRVSLAMHPASRGHFSGEQKQKRSLSPGFIEKLCFSWLCVLAGSLSGHLDTVGSLRAWLLPVLTGIIGVYGCSLNVVLYKRHGTVNRLCFNNCR